MPTRAPTRTLTRTQIIAGMWEGVLSASGPTPPALVVTHLGAPVAGVEVVPDEDAAGATTGRWTVRIPIPSESIADGVQTFLIGDAETGETLDSFAILAGEALAEDIRAEMDLLRAELDMLKRAFRRHCVETAQ